jgi:hypothetical protein
MGRRRTSGPTPPWLLSRGAPPYPSKGLTPYQQNAAKFHHLAHRDLRSRGAEITVSDSRELGTAAPSTRSSKKRKRAGTLPVVRVDSEEENTDSKVWRANAMMKTEMANLSSRAVSLQMTLEDYQQGLEESSNLLDMAKRKEEEMKAKHTQELKAAVDKINKLKDSENKRVLASFKNSIRYRDQKSEPEKPKTKFKNLKPKKPENKNPVIGEPENKKK